MKYIRIDINALPLNIIFQKTKWQIIILAAITFLLYGKTLNYEFIGLDEQSLLVQKKPFNEKLPNIPAAFSQHVFQSEGYIEAPGTIKFYRPLLSTSFILDENLSKARTPEDEAAGKGFSVFHFSNILYHLIAVIGLLFVLLRMHVPQPLAFFFALLFAVHPMLAQAIAWIPGRNDSLVCAFVLWSFYFLLRYFEASSAKNLFLHLVLFAGALFTKENAVMLLPLCLFSVFLLHGKKLKLNKKLFLACFYILIAAFWVYARKNAVGGIRLDSSFSDLYYSFVENLPLALQYLQKTILPVNLSVMASVHDTNYGWVMLALALFGAGIYFTKKIPWMEIIFGLLWFFLFLAPTLLFSYFEGMEHRSYLPAAGLLISIAFLEPVQNLLKKKEFLFGISAAVILIFGIITFMRLSAFADEYSYWKKAYETSEHSAVVCRDYGVIFTKKGNFPEAEKAYLEGIKRNPKETLLHYNLGVMYYKMERYEEAKAQLIEEMKINDKNFMLYHVLGVVYNRLQRPEEAAMMFEQAVKLNPKFDESYKELLSFYSQKKDTMNFTRCKNELEKLGYKIEKKR